MTATWTIAGATGKGGNRTVIGRTDSLSAPMMVALLRLHHCMLHTMV